MENIILKVLTLFCASLLIQPSYSQNLPSLLSGKNISATFSVVGYDEKTQEWGIAVATNNIYVGNSTIYIEPGVGAFSVIAETDPRYGINGLKQLRAGKSIKEAILSTQKIDDQKHYRQVSGIDKNGNVFAFTGEALKYWNGQVAHLLGEHYVVMGNQLDQTVLQSMAQAFENSTEPLPERLLNSIIAGQIAGGQISGKQSAALVVKGSNNSWNNQIDLRVDHSAKPLTDLRQLLDYHYGRIKINQTIYAVKAGNLALAKERLKKAESLLNGWNGMYSKLALANSLLGDDKRAIFWIQNALLDNPNWKVNLPAFYYLREHPALSNLINPETFTIQNWTNAIGMLIQLNRPKQGIELASQLITKGMESSYLHYLLGKCYVLNQDKAKAIKALKKALTLDNSNEEARLLLEEITRK